ncbi:NAD(P)-binding domain-containing protein [Nocardioides sp. NBC_00850]|uniref:NADPH-dependent F420 reductase n=1 Tax=Nocardioides sp. NBC_00850 TaxID=2976001 RepID=UPI00386F97F5|nr:NAD(P)-binding domain-containing protein [Nocardioides sp. NBC_00850]
MKIAVLGTGMVGRALAGRLSGLGHEVVIGTRDVEATLGRTGTDAMGTPPYAQWQSQHPDVHLVPLDAAGDHGDLVVNATSGVASLEAIDAVGPQRLDGKVLLDLAVPFDFSRGMPPTPTIPNTDSIAERIQRAVPRARVVKSLNTVFCDVMVDPKRVPGAHTLFVSGDDAAAKATVTALLGEFGWSADSVLDLGGIQTARNVEMYMLLYFNLAGVLQTFDFNIAVVRG